MNLLCPLLTAWVKTPPPPNLYDFMMQRYDLSNYVPTLLTSIQFLPNWAFDAEIPPPSQDPYSLILYTLIAIYVELLMQ